MAPAEQGRIVAEAFRGMYGSRPVGAQHDAAR